MAATTPVEEMLTERIYPRLHPYPPPVHSWASWVPKGPARRLTGDEVALLVLGRVNSVSHPLAPGALGDWPLSALEDWCW